VAGGKWVGSHGPTGRGFSRQTSWPLEHGPGMPEGCGLVEWRSCMSGLPVWQALEVRSLWRSCRPVKV
jgi:hypothetical protein